MQAQLDTDLRYSVCVSKRGENNLAQRSLLSVAPMMPATYPKAFSCMCFLPKNVAQSCISRDRPYFSSGLDACAAACAAQPQTRMHPKLSDNTPPPPSSSLSLSSPSILTATTAIQLRLVVDYGLEMKLQTPFSDTLSSSESVPKEAVDDMDCC